MEHTYDFSDKIGMLKKLRDYSINPDDDTIRIKELIREMFLHCPELLYAIHNEKLESELFTEDGKLNVDEDGEPLGAWDEYFGDSSNIRPFLFLPETQDETRNFICYQVSFKESPRYNSAMRYCLVTFNIMIHPNDVMDNFTGIPRHDLLASIIRENFAWTGLTTASAVPVQDVEQTSDMKYLIRTLQYQVELPNAIVKTDQAGTYYNNKRSY
jgi:hypothetical protein